MAPLYRNHFPEGIDFAKNPFQCNGHYSPRSIFVPSFVMISRPCWHFTVILSPAENPACSSQFPCKRICGGDFLKAPSPVINSQFAVVHPSSFPAACRHTISNTFPSSVLTVSRLFRSSAFRSAIPIPSLSFSKSKSLSLK